MTQAPLTPHASAPLPLRIAAGLVGLESAVLVGLAVFEAVSFNTSRAAMGLTTTLFFVLFALVLAFAARGLLHAAGVARSLAVFAQLIALGVAWSFRGGSTTWVSVLVVVVAVPVLVAVFHPASIRAVEGR